MSSIGYGPLQRIDGPLPLPPPYGLLQAAEAPAAGVRIVVDTSDGGTLDMNDVRGPQESMDEALARLRAEGSIPAEAGRDRWINGVEVYPYPPDQVDFFDACAGGVGTYGVKGDGEDVAHPQFGALTVYLAETCASFKVWDQAAFIARATIAFAAVEGAGVARNFMTGAGLPLNPHLADGNAECVFPNGDTATNAINALALLEKQIGLSGKLGLVHCSPQFATSLRDRFAIDNKTGVIRTINGNVIIADAGYAAGSQPHGHAAATGTQEWVYATGAIDIRRSEMFVLPDDVSEALDRGTAGSATRGRPNRITYRAERFYIVDWDTEVQAAVLADRCQAAC